MDHEQNDLLLSAYLDGELSADERAQVEQLLATSAEARQLVDELRAIRAGLQALPQHRLEPDFAKQVLRRAEQEQQVSNAPPNEISTTPTWRPTVLRSWRGIGWSIAALAAAVIIMVATRKDEQGDRQVARNGGISQVASNEAKVAQKLAADRLEKQMQPSAAAPASVAKEEISAAADSGEGASYSRSAPNPSESVAGNVQLRNAVGGAQSFDGAAPAPAAPQAGAPQAVSNPEETVAPNPSDAEPVLVVQVGLKQEPGAGKEFEQMLANNRIVLESDQDSSSDKKLRDEASARQDSRDSQDIERGLTAALKQDAISRAQSTFRALKSKGRALAQRAASVGGLDVVYVEATREQVQAVLNDLGKSQSVVVLGVSASPLSRESNSLSAELRQSGKSMDGHIPPGRAQRVPAVLDWLSKNFDNLPDSILLDEKKSNVANLPAETAPNSVGPQQLRNSSPSLAVDKSALSSPAAPAAEAANSTTESKKDLAEPQYQRALFVLRSIDASEAAKSSAAMPAAQPATVPTDAVEKK